jgi:uncharacterized protein (UPF0276 family)
MADFVSGAPDASWLEIHSENFFAPGGPRVAQLDAVRAHYPISCHGVGLSLGTAEGISKAHLERLAALVERVEPILVSEHLSFSVVDGLYVNDLLPLPYTEEALDVVSRNIAQTQDRLRRPILIENPSSYLTFVESVMPEWEFLDALVKRTGCGLLLDVNNVYVSSINNNFDAKTYLDAVPANAVGEIHLAGHLVDGHGDEQVLIDTHGDTVCNDVWNLYEHTLKRIGARPTLIEWDTDIPPLDVLLSEAARAQEMLDRVSPENGSVHVA